MKAPPKRRPLQFLVFFAFLIAALGMAAVSYFAYQSVDRLANDLKKNAGPNLYFRALQEVISGVTKAEASVRSFTITQDDVMLDPYYEVVGIIDDKLEALNEFSSQETEMDSINSLTETKFLLMDSIIRVIEKGERITAFDKLYRRIVRAEKDPRLKPKVKPKAVSIEPLSTISPPTDTIIFMNDSAETMGDQAQVAQAEVPDKRDNKRRRRKKKNIFSMIFGKRDKGVVIDTLAEDSARRAVAAISQPFSIDSAEALPETKPLPKRRTSSSKDLLKEIRRSAEAYSEQENQLLKEQARLILNLTRQDEVVMAKMMSILRKMERDERQKGDNVASEASRDADRTTGFMAAFALFVIVIFLVLMVIILRDIGRNRKMQVFLSREKARAEKFAKAKEEFLSNMSHEIRTPMNAIIGFTEQLNTTPLNPKQNRYLQTVSRSADHLLALLNDILDYSKLGSGKVKLEQLAFRPMDVLRDAEATFTQSAHKKGLELRLLPPEDVPEVIQGDPLRLKQMLFNLLSNAIKFTDEGEVTIRAKGATFTNNECLLGISVKDTGIGIPEEKQAQIFIDFEQADSSTTRQYGGTGLGLSITRKLVALHGGELLLDSEAGEWTEFTLLIPYQLGDEADLMPQLKTYSGSFDALKGMQALVADDEPYNRELVAIILEKWGVEADFVENGQEAFDHAADSAYDFILMDLQMPIMGGIEATQKIKRELEGERPIIGLTATSTPIEVEQALAAGIDAHMLKPFKEAELYELLLDKLHIEHDHDNAGDIDEPDEPQAPELPEMIDNDRPYDLKAIFELGNNDEAFALRMLRIFHENTHANLAVMKEGLDTENWTDVGFAAHKIIPPSRHLGLNDLVDQLKEIELAAQEGAIGNGFHAQVESAYGELLMVLDAVAKDLEEIGQD